MTRLQAAGSAIAFASCALAAGGCAHIASVPSEGSGTPTPVASGVTPLPTGSGLCTTTSLDPNATIVVSIDPDFAATTTTYGTIFGYAAYNPTGTAALPTAAAVINASTSDAVVFANYDPGTVAHTATGFPGATAFPGEPYPFPAGDTSPVGTEITDADWSTGSLGSFGNTSSTVCYSQTFTLPSSGTFYFGDDPLYNSPSSFRGVIVVSQ